MIGNIIGTKLVAPRIDNSDSRHLDPIRSMTDYRNWIIWSATLTVAVGATAFHSSNYFFLFDDTALLTVARDFSVLDIFSSAAIGFYRPGGFIASKLQYLLFGWQLPAGYAYISIAIHAASVLLLYRILHQLDFGRLATALCALLFLVSPWATEAALWFSAQFDLFAVFFGLASSLALVHFQRHGRTSILLTSASLFGMALLFKENIIVLPIFVFAILLRQKTILWRSIARILAPFAIVAACYLMVRSQLLPDLGGAYGNLSALYGKADILNSVYRYLQALLFLQSKITAPSLSWLAFFHTIGTLACIAAAATKPKVFAAVTALFFVTLAPVAWMQVSAHTTAGGRLLYAPGILWCLLIGIGAAQLWSSARRIDSLLTVPFTHSVLAVLLVAGMAGAYVSASNQLVLWRFATGFARNTVDYMFSSPAISHPCIHITNLPSATTEGPFLFKSYNFIHHLQAADHTPGIRFSANTVTISAIHSDVVIPGRPDMFGINCTDDEAVQITLPLDRLRPPVK